MEEKIANRSARVIICEPNDSIRMGMTQALKELGFAQIERCRTIKEAFAYLEQKNEPPDWIVSSLMPEAEINGLHLLEILLRNKRFHHCRVSFFLEVNDHFSILSAFEMGLFSWHDKVMNYDGIKREFANLLHILNTNAWNSSLTAMDYLYRYLKDVKDYKSMTELCQAYLMKFPSDGNLMLKFAETEFLEGHQSKALLCLQNFKSLYPDRAKEAMQISNRYLNDTNLAEIPANDAACQTFAAQFNLSICAVVDSDESVHQMLKHVLSGMGINFIKHLYDGAQAASWFESDEAKPQLIIMEWKLHKVAGHALIQRIRSGQTKNVPVIVYSSVVDEKDRLLLREIGVSDILKKPMTLKLLDKTLRALIQQEHHAEEDQVLERRIQHSIASGDLVKAKEYLDRYLTITNISESNKAILKAEFLLKEGNLKEAKQLAITALQITGESLPLLNLTGKILLKLHEYELAKKFLSRAKQISPRNIDRLCALAETHHELGERSAADSELSAAKKIDADNQAVIETEAKIEVDKGNTEYAKNLISRLESSKELVAQLNNKAVYLASQDKLDESILLYQKAIKSLPVADDSLKALIHYNLALAYAKAGKGKEAEESLADATAIPNSIVQQKAKSLHSRVKEANASGAEIRLNLAIKQDEELFKGRLISIKDKLLPIAVDGKAGMLCCHLIYSNKNEITARVWDLLQSRPRIVEMLASAHKAVS